MELSGYIIKKLTAVGSKSERDAVILVSPNGEFVLRRKGGNPFVDPGLDALVGKSVACSGVLMRNTFIVDDVREVEGTA